MCISVSTYNNAPRHICRTEGALCIFLTISFLQDSYIQGHFVFASSPISFFRIYLELAGRMQLLPQICHVNYVGLPDNPYYELAQAQFGGTAGAMICIELADRQACFDFIDNLKLIHRATNLFDNRTLAIHPASTIFGNFTAAERESMDICDTTVRISVGLEDVDDLFEDIRQALQ